jgi:hypothetical protein
MRQPSRARVAASSVGEDGALRDDHASARPDWEGVFDLADPASQDAFGHRFSRCFASRP